MVADGHGDEIGQTDKIALRTKAKIFTTFTYSRGYFEPRKIPAQQIFRVGPGSRVRVDGITPPTVHQMVLTLERRGFISREPGEARSIRILPRPCHKA